METAFPCQVLFMIVDKQIKYNNNKIDDKIVEKLLGTRSLAFIKITFSGDQRQAS